MVEIISKIELEGSPIVEIVAKALWAHQNCPGTNSLDPLPGWPPARPALVAYWNKAKAVVAAQHEYVRRREMAANFAERTKEDIASGVHDGLFKELGTR